MPINVVLPVASSDESRLKIFLEVLKHFGPYNSNDILIVPTAEMNARPDVREWMNEVAKLFNHCHIRPLNNTPTGGWPAACNMHFKWGTLYQDEVFGATRKAWLWLELDCTPLRKGWLEELDYEYRLGDKPYMGYIGKSHQGKRLPDGTVQQVLNDDPHMEGVAIYPSDHKQRSILTLAPSTKVPFDIYCRYETTRRGQTWLCRPTDVLIHRWQTTSYQIKDGFLQCLDASPKTPEISSAGRIDLTGKVLHHGDKGESLGRLIIQYGDAQGIMNAANGVAVAQRTEHRTSNAEVTGSTPVSNTPPMTEVASGVFLKHGYDLEDSLKPLIEALGYVKLPPVVEVPNPEPGVNTAQPSDTPATRGASEGVKDSSEVIHTQPAPVSGGAQPFPTIVDVQNALGSADKKLRLGDLMGILGVPTAKKGEFVSLLNENGYRAAAPAYWVSVAA